MLSIGTQACYAGDHSWRSGVRQWARAAGGRGYQAGGRVGCMAETNVPGGGARGGAKKAAAKGKTTRAGTNARGARSEIAFTGHLVTVRLQPVTRPDGREALFEVVEHPDAVAIVAVRYEPTAGGTARPL